MPGPTVQFGEERDRGPSHHVATPEPGSHPRDRATWRGATQAASGRSRAVVVGEAPEVPFETPTPEPTQHRDFFWSTCIPPKVEEDHKLYQ